MIIPPEKLAIEALKGIVESFVLRDGTDYGDRELSFEEKVEELMPQVMRGEILIVYDESTESVNLLPKSDYVDTHQDF